jgi:hypothetical protein
MHLSTLVISGAVATVAMPSQFDKKKHKTKGFATHSLVDVIAKKFHVKETGFCSVMLRKARQSMHRAIATSIVATATSAAVAAEATSPDQGPWWLGPLVTVLAAAIGAAAIVWQLGRQHRNESLRQTENFKAQLKLQVYQEFSSRLSAASDAVQTTAMYAYTAQTHVQIYSSQAANGFTPAPIADRALKLIELNSNAANEVVETIFLLEKYFIVHPDLDILRLALSSAEHDVWESFHPLFEFMLSHFPMDVLTEHGQKVENVRQLTPDQRTTLQTLSGGYYDAAMDLGCYLDDMRIELQTLFLSNLFPNTIPRRRPADPSKKVLSLEASAVKSLRQHFLKNIAWGKKAIASQLDVHHEFHGRAPSFKRDS